MGVFLQNSEQLQSIPERTFFAYASRVNNRGRGEWRDWSPRGVKRLCCVNGHRPFICQRLTHGRRCTCVTHNSKLANSEQGSAANKIKPLGAITFTKVTTVQPAYTNMFSHLGLDCDTVSIL